MHCKRKQNDLCLERRERGVFVASGQEGTLTALGRPGVRGVFVASGQEVENPREKGNWGRGFQNSDPFQP